LLAPKKLRQSTERRCGRIQRRKWLKNVVNAANGRVHLCQQRLMARAVPVVGADGVAQSLLVLTDKTA
jgi:hypothetical protein